MKKRTLILSLVISCCFILFLCSAKNSQAETTTKGENWLYLYREETNTVILREKGADTAADLADGYKLVSYEDVKEQGLIQHVIIGDGVSSIDRNAMPNWISCKSVTVGNGITALPEKLFCPDAEGLFFQACGALETISLGKSVRTIGDYAFYRCKSLKNIIVDPENPYLKIERKGLYSKDGKTLYAYPVAAEGEPVIADGTQKISPVVFAFSHVTNMEIPASVEALSGGLFEECEKLEKLTFAKNANCIRTESTKTWSGDGYKRSMFWKCKNLKEVRFGEKFQQLAPDTFKNSALRSVYFGKAFQGIAKNNKTKAGKVFYDENPEEISDDLIFPGLEKIEISKQNKNFKVKNAALLSKNGKKLYYYPTARKNKSYTVPASVNTITKGAFYRNKYLQQVHTGKNTKTIGKFAFEYCTKLKKVFLGKKVKTLKVGAFEDCHKLTTIVNLEKVKKIEGDALKATDIIYVPDWTTHEYPATVRGNVMYFYMTGSKKTTWRVIKGKKRVKILKRYKNSARIKVKFKKKGYVAIQAQQGSKKIKYDFYVD